MIEDLKLLKAEGNIIRLPKTIRLEHYPEIKRAIQKAGGICKFGNFHFRENAQLILNRIIEENT